MSESTPTAPPTTEATAPPEPAPPPADDKYADALRRFSSDLRMTGQVFQSMLDRGVTIQRHHYDQLLKTFLDFGDVIGVKKLLDRMAAEGHDTDPALRWQMAIATARTGAVDAALAAMDALRGEGIEAPDELGPAIAGLHVQVGNLAAARAVLRDLAAKGIAGNDQDYRALLTDVIRRRAINDSLELLAAMQAVGRVPEVSQATDLVVAIARGGNIERAVEVRQALVAAGAAVAGEAWEVIAQGLLKNNHVRQARLEVEKMEAAGHEPNAHLRNVLALARINSLDADKAWEVVAELGVLPSSAVLEALLTKTINAKNVQRALGIVDWILMLGATVPVDAAGKVIDGLLPAQLDTAIELLQELRRHGVPTDRRSARHLLDALVKAKRIDEAVALLDQLRTAKSLTRASDHLGVFAGLVRAKRVDDAMALLERMLTEGARPKSAEASRIVNELVRAKQFDRARGILDVLDEAKVTVDEPTYRALLWAFAQANDENGAKAVFERMVGAGITPDDRHTKALAWASGDVRRKLSERELLEAEEKLKAEMEAEITSSEDKAEEPEGEVQEPPETASVEADMSAGATPAEAADAPTAPTPPAEAVPPEPLAPPEPVSNESSTIDAEHEPPEIG